jgi:hypothetical protein
VSFFRIPSPSGGAERAKKGHTETHLLLLLVTRGIGMQEVGSTNPLNRSLPIVALDLWLPYNPYNLSHKSNNKRKGTESWDIGKRK